jgi:hypothetical protein
MAFSDSYSALKTTVASYLARSDLTAMIPDFIRLAELRLQRDLRIRQMLTVAQASTTGGVSTVGVPSDFLEMRDIHIVANPVRTLSYEAPNSFYRNTRSTESGVPNSYTVLAGDMQLAPLPDSTYVLQMLYYAKPPVLSDTNASNIFLANTPDALLYGALGEAEPYLMNDARLQVWAALYDRAVNSISTSDQASEYSGQPMSMSYNVR